MRRLQAWQDEQNDEERARLEIDGAFQLPEASMEGNHQEVTDGNSSDEDASESDWNSVGQGARQQRLFRMRGTPKQSPEDARPVTTHQHILGLAKVRQVCPYASSLQYVMLFRFQNVICHSLSFSSSDFLSYNVHNLSRQRPTVFVVLLAWSLLSLAMVLHEN